MKTPSHWANQNLISVVLTPLGLLYSLATRIRFMVSKPQKVECPVICVGNLTAGGTGKTPVSVALAEMLQQRGKKPFFLTRGYGGTLKNIIVDSQKHSAALVGDEPLLLAEQAPTVVNPNRAAGAQMAIAHGADCLIMDDGFQNPGLHKDISFLVFDGAFGIGNGKAIPAGPLREDFYQGLSRAQAVIILGDDRHQLAKKVACPVFYGRVEEVRPTATEKHVLAFAGIGRPQKLYDSLQKCGLNVQKTVDFPDHHFYTRDELQALITEAENRNLEIYTTSKDFVKIPADLQPKFNVLKIKIAWQDEAALQHFLTKNI